MTIPSAATKSGTQVVQRVAALLRGVSARNRIGARLIDLCTEVAIERPTAHRILQGLVRVLMVSRFSIAYTERAVIVPELVRASMVPSL